MKADPFLLDREAVCTGSRLGVLLAVVVLGEERPTVTVRDVCARVGIRSSSTVWKHLSRLRDDGLVTWEHGRDGTLRATLARVPVRV